MKMKIEFRDPIEILGKKFERRGIWGELRRAINSVPEGKALRVEFDTPKDVQRAKNAVYQANWKEYGLTVSIRKDRVNGLVLWFVPQRIVNESQAEPNCN